MANSKIVPIEITAALDAAGIETAINAQIVIEETAGFSLDKPVTFKAVPAPGGILKLFALLSLVPNSGGLGRGSKVKLYTPDDLSTLEADLQTVIDAQESTILDRYLVGLDNVSVGRGASSTFAVLLTFGLNPSRGAGALGGQEDYKLVSGGVLTEDGGGSTIAAYNFDVSAADVILTGEGGVLALVNASQLLANADAMALDGGVPVALTADGQTCYIVLVILSDAATKKFAYIFGAEAADSGEAIPTKTQMADALEAKYGNDWDGKAAVIADIVLVQRQAVDTIVVTASAALTGAPRNQVILYQNSARGLITAADITPA